MRQCYTVAQGPTGGPLILRVARQLGTEGQPASARFWIKRSGREAPKDVGLVGVSRQPDPGSRRWRSRQRGDGCGHCESTHFFHSLLYLVQQLMAARVERPSRRKYNAASTTPTT